MPNNFWYRQIVSDNSSWHVVTLSEKILKFWRFLEHQHTSEKSNTEHPFLLAIITLLETIWQ